MLPIIPTKEVLAIGLAVCAMAAAISTLADAREALRVQGSTTFTAEILGRHQRAIELAAGQELTVVPNKSTPGLVALLEDKADLAMISTTLQSATTSARKTHPDLPYDLCRHFPSLAPVSPWQCIPSTHYARYRSTCCAPSSVELL